MQPETINIKKNGCGTALGNLLLFLNAPLMFVLLFRKPINYYRYTNV